MRVLLGRTQFIRVCRSVNVANDEIPESRILSCEAVQFGKGLPIYRQQMNYLVGISFGNGSVIAMTKSLKRTKDVCPSFQFLVFIQGLPFFVPGAGLL